MIVNIALAEHHVDSCDHLSKMILAFSSKPFSTMSESCCWLLLLFLLMFFICNTLYFPFKTLFQSGPVSVIIEIQVRVNTEPDLSNDV